MSSQALPETTIPRPIESAPSQTAVDEPSWAHTIGLMGMMLSVLGLTVVTFNEVYGPRIIGKSWGFIFVAIGILSMLFHAVRDKDIQIRRAYGMIGFALLGLMAVLTIFNGRNFLAYGWACSLASMFFLLACLRHETDPAWRWRILTTLGGVGAAMALVSFLGGIWMPGFIVTYGLLFGLLGLVYLCAFVGQSDPTTEIGHRTGQALGTLAFFAILYAVVRSLMPTIVKMNVAPFFVPTGLLLMFLGVLYGSVALGIVSDNRLIVMTRKELTAYFYSPVAYSVMLGMVLLGAFSYLYFLSFLVAGAVRFEPIVGRYFQLLAPIVVMFLVPAITMRLLAEEKRSGTYEVLMCAPVRETAVVLSKFIACLIFFMMLWAMWAILLIGLRVEGGKEFDYRPILSFYLALAVCGASFISMGLFFSSLSGNQIVAAVLTFIAMLVFYLVGFLSNVKDIAPIVRSALQHVSYDGLWQSSLKGKLMVRDLILQGSFSFFWLFLTVKVLEARRWS